MSIMNLLWPIVAWMDVVRTAMSLAIRKLAEGTLGLPNKKELPSETAICFRRRSLSRVANSPMNNVCTTTVAAEPEVSQKMHLEYLLPDSGSFRKPFIYRPKKIDKSYWLVVIYTTTQWKCVQITTYLREHRTWRKWRKCTGSWRNEGFVVNALNVNRHTHHPPVSAASTRDSYSEYFNGPWSFPWQRKRLFSIYLHSRSHLPHFH